jgi:hypothetical protein
MMAIDMGSTAINLPYHAVFDILSRTPVRSVCRFRCVSKGPLLVDAGSFAEEEPYGGRNMRLMDMYGNVVRVISGVRGYGMISSSSGRASMTSSVSMAPPVVA